MARHPRLFFSALLAALLAGPFLPILLAPAGRVLGNPACDNPAAFYYYYAFAGSCWRQGIIPLWNPHIMLGMPFLGEGQAAVFHPLSWLCIPLSTGVALNWLIALGFILAGLCCFGYLRALRLSRAAALGGALAWAYSDVLISRIHAGHLSVLLTLIEAPLILMLWERYRATRRAAWLCGIALAYGAMILGAHPQILYLFSLFLLLYVFLHGACAATARAAAWRHEARSALWLGAAMLLGVGIGAIQLLPTAGFAAISFRRAASPAFCAEGSYAPFQLLTLLVPRFFGFSTLPGPGQYWGPANLWEMSNYFGLAPLLLLPLGIAAAPARRRVALLGCALFFFLAALGENTPFFTFLYRRVPFYNVFRVPARHMIFAQFCLVTLGAYGLDRLFRRPLRRDKAFFFTLLFAGALFAALAGLYVYFIPGHGAPGSHWMQLKAWMDVKNHAPASTPVDMDFLRAAASLAGREIARAALLLAAGVALILAAPRLRARRMLPLAALALILADLFMAFMPLMITYDEAITRCPPERVAPFKGWPYPARVFDPEAQKNIAMVCGMSSPAGYAGNTLERYNRFINAAQGFAPDTPQLHFQIRAYAPLRRYMAPDAIYIPERGASPADMQFILARGEGWLLARPPEALPRAFLAESPRAAPDPESALHAVLAPGAELLRSPIIERPALSVAGAPLGAGEGARIVAFSPNRVELETRADRPRMLVLCEMFEKNWSARVNGAPAAIAPANYLFRAVEIPAGRARVVFTYAPAAFARGALITLILLALTLALGLAAALRRRGAGRPARFPAFTTREPAIR